MFYSIHSVKIDRDIIRIILLQRDDDFDVSKKYLCIIPGMEGHYARFRVMCERLKIHAIVLQPGLDLLHESIRETAERYAKVIVNTHTCYWKNSVNYN